jgi:hypothetical protein
MSEVKVNKISPRTNCGTTTLGDSGDSFVIPSGVTITNNGTQTGFGRTGTVDWQTSSIKTATFTAANGEGYFVNTTGGEITSNLPAGSAGAIVSFSDYTRTFGTNKLTVTPNGSEKIGGVNASIFLDVNGQAVTLVYVDATEGWINIQNAEDTEEGIVPGFVAATGGTITTVCTNFKVHTFTGPGTFAVSSAGNCAGSNKIDYLVVAGGGGGATQHSGAGGAGGFRGSFPSPGSNAGTEPVTVQSYPITVGGGGAAQGPGPSQGGTATSGSNSIWSTITGSGGGGGGGFTGANCTGAAGANGGSGGGGGSASGPGAQAPPVAAGGTGNTPALSSPASPVQGHNGGSGAGHQSGGGGGGGAAAVGSNAAGGSGGNAGVGGAGKQNNIDTNNYYWAGGGGGGSHVNSGGAGGIGGGGGGGSHPSKTDGAGGGSAINAGATASHNGTGGAGGTNSGGGGGGSHAHNIAGGNGGSGIVIIRYKFQ